MHILIFSDQHVASLGGAQTSILLQRKYLERAGHRVTICQPRSFKPGIAAGSAGADGSAGGCSAAQVELNTPAFPVTANLEYSLTLPTGFVQRWLDKRVAKLPPIDLVLVQADFAQALIGYRFARRHRLPVVHTAHTNIGESFRRNTGRFARPLLRAFLLLQRNRLGGRRSRLQSAEFAIYDEYARRAAAVITPSQHFQTLLRAGGVSTGRVASAFVHAITGVDDDLVDPLFAVAQRDSARIIWSGRMSPEKRLLPFIESLRLLAASGAAFNVEIYGEGVEKKAAIAAVTAAGLADRVRFCGRVSYPEMLRAQRQAGVLAQTSIGFETQGMTVYESLTLGTAVVVSDPGIYAEAAGVAGAPDSLVAVTDASPESLASALAEALSVAQRNAEKVCDDEGAGAPAGSGKPAAVAGECPAAPASAKLFLQSAQTAKLLSVYNRVLGL